MKTIDPRARKLAASLAAMVVVAASFGLMESVQQELAQEKRVVARQFTEGFIADGFIAEDVEVGDRAVPKSVPARAPVSVRAQPAPKTPASIPAPMEPMLEAEPPMVSASMPDSTVTSEREEMPALLQAPSRSTELPADRRRTASEGQAQLREFRARRQTSAGAATKKKRDIQRALRPQSVAEMSASELSKDCRGRRGR